MISSIILTGLGLIGNFLLIAYIVAMINRMKRLEEERQSIRKLIIDLDDKRRSIKRHYKKQSLSKFTINLVKDQSLQRRRSSKLCVLKSVENQLTELTKWNRYVPYLTVLLTCDTLLIIYYCCYILFKRFHVDHILLTNISNFTCRFLTFSTRLICSASLWICTLMFIDIVLQYLMDVHHKTFSTSNYTLSANSTPSGTALLVDSAPQLNMDDPQNGNTKNLRTNQFHEKRHGRSLQQQSEQNTTNEEGNRTNANSLKKKNSFNNHRKYVILFGITVSTLINIYILDRFYLDQMHFCKFNANGATIASMLKIELYTYKVCGLLLPILLFFLFSLLLLCVRYTLDENDEQPLLDAPLFTSIIMCSLMAILYLPYLILSIQTVHSSLKLLRSIELLDLKEDIFVLPSTNETILNNGTVFTHFPSYSDDTFDNKNRLMPDKSMNTNAAYISYCLNIIRYIFHISKFFVYFFTYPSFRHWLLRSS